MKSGINIGLTVQAILRSHIDQMAADLNSLAEGTIRFSFPFFPEDSLCEFAATAREIFQSEPSLLEIDSPVVVVGDLHGHILDLYKILTFYDLPPKTKYLFLGDLVDRGAFSLETLCLVYALKLSYPNSVYLVRGNHEFRDISLRSGFYKEVISMYNNSHLVFDTFCESFQYIPLACKIGTLLCLHAGLSPDLTSINQISEIQRPISHYNTSILCGILWSDPSEDPEKFCASRRGTGFYFGPTPLQNFLNSNNLTVLIRGHECVDGAISHFGGKVITVFSASSYCGILSNESGTLYINQNHEIQAHLFPPLPYLTREKAQPIDVIVDAKTRFVLNFKNNLNYINECNNLTGDRRLKKSGIRSSVFPALRSRRDSGSLTPNLTRARIKGKRMVSPKVFHNSFSPDFDYSILSTSLDAIQN